MPEPDAEEAVNFLVKNVGRRPRDLSHGDLRKHVEALEVAARAGLPTHLLLTLSSKVIFSRSYYLHTRRRLLNCLVPEGQDFPLQIVPLAVSSATLVGASPMWQYSIITWLGGLLEYGILLPTERYVHICYTSIFNMAFNLHLCAVACKVLSQITVMEDVTPSRTFALMKLKQKPAFYIPVSYLLRIYHLFRPDLVVGRLSDKRVVTQLPQNLKVVLLAARQRLQDSLEGSSVGQSDDRVWQDRTRAEKFNMYQRNTAVPCPQANIYTATIEEKKKKVIYVTQYQRFRDLVRGLEDQEWWVWPTNSSSHLAYPVLVPLFRPHQKHVQVSLTNWLELALRTEVVEGIGNPSEERQERLLDAVLELSRVTATPLPVTNHFLTDYMTKWNQSDHFERMMALLGQVTFSSHEFVYETLVRLVARLLVGAPMVTWCRVVAALTNTACSWALTAHHEANTPYTEERFVWPQQVEQESAVQGLMFLTARLERFFLAAAINYRCHPLVLHHILDYYHRVNQYSDVLKLPIVVFPPPSLAMAVLVSADLTTTHRLGQLLASMKERLGRLRSALEEGSEEEEVLQEGLGSATSINQVISFFISGIYLGNALTGTWQKALDPFYPFRFLDHVLGKENAQRFAAITDNLVYLPFFAEDLMEADGSWTVIQQEDIRSKVLGELKAAGLTGIEECVNVYRKD